MGYYDTPRAEIDYFREEYEFLSNFYPAKVYFDGITYYNSEAAYQAQKCKTYEERLKFASLSADESKRLGRNVDMRPDWDNIKYEIMKQIVYAKFTQNPFLARNLLDTGDKVLKEGNYWKDLYWGVDLKTGDGENNLGKILMALRKDFREHGIPAVSSPFDSLKGPYKGMWIDDRDITMSDCECIVNAANETLLGGSGVDGAIHRAAGPQLKEECKKLGGCAVGEVKLTNGYRLNAKYVIHAVGPKYPTEDCAIKLADCYRKSLDRAKEQGIHSIAFPSISTGKFSYPKKEACKIAVETVYNWLRENKDYEMKVIFACVDPVIYKLVFEHLTFNK